MTETDFVALGIRLLGPQCLEGSKPPHNILFCDGLVSLDAITGEIAIGDAPPIHVRDFVNELEVRKKKNGGDFDAVLAQVIAEKNRPGRVTARAESAVTQCMSLSQTKGHTMYSSSTIPAFLEPKIFEDELADYIDSIRTGRLVPRQIKSGRWYLDLGPTAIETDDDLNDYNTEDRVRLAKEALEPLAVDDELTDGSDHLSSTQKDGLRARALTDDDMRNTSSEEADQIIRNMTPERVKRLFEAPNEPVDVTPGIAPPNPARNDAPDPALTWSSLTLLPYNGSGPIPIASEFADLDYRERPDDSLEEWLEQQEQWLQQHKKQLLTALELLNANGIYLKNYNPGNHSRTCPRCLASRKKENQKKRCLSIKIDDKGATWNCHNCSWSGPEKGQQHTNGRPTPATIVREQVSDEVAQQEPTPSPAPAKPEPSYDDKNFVAIYDYPGFQKVRFPKGHEPRFLIRHRNPSSNRAGKGWDWGAGDADTSVLYRKDEIDEAIANGYEIALVEGEKDADRLWSIGIPATCSAHGAAAPNQKPKWTVEHSEQLRGANLVVFGDHDAQGYAHQDVTCKTSLGIAKRVRILKLADHWPEIKDGNDVSDWLDAGHTREQLDALIEQAPDYASQLPNDGTVLGYSWHLIWHGETDPTDARKALVQDLLPETGVALIPGQWGTYKTFVADDLCAAVMTATTFANKQVMRQGGVLFLACEGHNEVDIRLTAAFQKHGGTGKAPFAWVKGCPRLLDKNAGKILAAMVKHAATKMMHDFGLPVVMVIIDTAGKAAGLSKQGELNDDAVAKIIMSALAEASILTGALFVGVAHFGKNVETGTKGSTGFEDDADVVLALLGERGINGTVPNPLLCARKRKSGPNGEEFPFQTEEAEVDSEKTLTIRWTDAATAKPAPKKKDDPWAAKSLRHLRQTLMNMLADCGSEQRPYPDGPIVRAVDIEIVRAEFYKTYPAIGDETTKKEARRKAFNRAISDADHKHLISTRDIGPTTFIWLANPTDPATAPAPPPKPKTPQKRPARSKSDDFPYDGPVVEVPDQGPDPLDEHGAPID
jgi:hypothetical protein